MESGPAYVREIRQRLYELAVYGNFRQRKRSFSAFKQGVLASPDFRPIFFLSTGRTGTQFFTHLLNQCRALHAFHAPQPELIQQGKIVYETYQQTHPSSFPLIHQLAGQTFLAAREHLLHTSYLHKKTYVETNNRITFFGPAIRAVIPHARFVHVYRHPGDFIRSGIRRRWYTGGNPHDIGRIIDTATASAEQRWKQWNKIQKIAWLWNETNRFIEDFLSTLDPAAYFRLNFDTLSEASVQALLHFAGVTLPSKKISNAIKTPVNQQADGSYPAYDDWPEADRQKVQAICELAPHYHYVL